MNPVRAVQRLVGPLAMLAVVAVLLGVALRAMWLAFAGGLILAVTGWMHRRLLRALEADVQAAASAEISLPEVDLREIVEPVPDPARARVRMLERILASANRLSATRGRAELAEGIVAAAAELGGFGRVRLSLWDDAVDAFVPRAFVGHAPQEVAVLTAVPLSGEDFAELAAPSRRYSDCFLVPADAGSGDRHSPAPSAGPWTAGLELIAPLVASSGERLGFLSLDKPVDGRVPDPEGIRLLEFLVRQAATALEAAGIYERLAERNAELSIASRRLDSLAKMKRNFVANVSHELRTPLTSISAYSELLQSNLGNLSGDALTEFLGVIHSESQRLSGVISDILEINSMEQGRPALNTSEVDLAHLIRRQAEGWLPRAASQDLQLVIEAGDSPVPLSADHVLLRQLFDHLLDNAIKFTPAGGTVRVTVGESGTAARVVVEDTGIGVPDDHLGEIFQSFFQVDGSATRMHSGQGVGLTICHDIVQHHDGRIWAENVEPRGTRFTVLLPRRAPVVLNREGGNTAAGGLEPGEFLQRLMHWVVESLGVQSAALMLPDDEDQALVIRAAVGLPGTVVQGTRLRRGAGFAGRAWATGGTLLVEDVTTDAAALRDVNEPRYTTPSLLCVPLRDGERCVGVVTVNNKVDGSSLDDDDRLLLEGLAPRLVGLLTRYAAWHDEGLALQQVRLALRAMTTVGQPRRESLHGLCREICLATARRSAFERQELAALAFALVNYDVGLSRVPPQLLARAGRLDRDEERLVQGHVAAGLEILTPLAVDGLVLRIIGHHHENIDGSGYPTGLAGEAIPAGARLLRLTDTLAALLSRRPWRGAWTLDQSVRELSEQSGRCYCPRLLPVFLEEVEARRDRILALQADGCDGQDLRRPLLDREGMVSIRG
jgi:signal transduction histidine kinase/putative methionine-R-sulfoxide reductase with GAF domain